VAEANSEASKICVQCSREFVPWAPKRGPRPSRCRDCYPESRTKLVLAWIRGEHVPELRPCASCGDPFRATKGKRRHCAKCQPDATKENVSRLQARYWRDQRGPKPPCAECGTPIDRPHSKRFCSPECGRAVHNRRSCASRRARIVRAEREGFDPLEILSRDQWTCYLCGQRTPPELRGRKVPDAPEIDHIIPLSKGGSHTRANVACACRACNLAKSDSMPLERRRRCVPTARQYR
jgi:5-methylcytosine-specific restriction endonuclease McrA